MKKKTTKTKKGWHYVFNLPDDMDIRSVWKVGEWYFLAALQDERQYILSFKGNSETPDFINQLPVGGK